MPRLESVHPTLPSDLKREARAMAIREGKDLSLVVRESLREYVKDAPEDPENED